MSHLEASTGKLPLVLVILLAPTRIRGRTATASARFGHGRSGIDIAHKEQHSNVGNILDSGGIIALWNLGFIEKDVFDRVRNLNSLAAIGCIDVERGEGRHRLRLCYWLHLGLGRSRLWSN